MVEISKPDAGGALHARLKANLFCALSMLTWAIGFPAAEILLENWAPETLIVARLALAVSVLLPIWMLLEGAYVVKNARWARGTVIGGIGFGIGTYLILLAQSLSDPVTVAVVAATMPIAGATLEVVLDHRRLRWPLMLGIILALAGGIVAAGANLEAGYLSWGAFCAFISVVIFSWGSRAAVKEFPELSPLGQSTLTLTGAAIFCIGLLIVFRVTGFSDATFQPLDQRGWFLLATYALAAMALSQVFWLLGVGRLGIALASFHINSASFYVMLLMVAMGSTWNWTQALGAAIVACGVFVAQIRPSGA